MGGINFLRLRSFPYRLAITGIVIIAAFNLGAKAYIYSINQNEAKAELRSLSEKLSVASPQNLELYAEDKKITVNGNEIKQWFEPYTRTYTGKDDLRFSSLKINKYLASIALAVDKEPVNAKFEMENGRAKVFVGSIPGKKLNILQSENEIVRTLLNGKNSVQLIIDETKPAVSLEKINSLGIKNLLGRGESDYGKSSASRIKNIKVGIAKYNGLIIKPGEEFSFNNSLGGVDAENGFEPELVIKNGELVKEYGGGICQVSTTLFRAAILAGLPITERKPHSFPVQYYNPQGFDATIYPGVTDLKFVNNTPNYILIQSRVSGSRVIFEIYGTDDERKVTMDGPHQYDQKANGSMKAYFARKVSYPDGTEKEERFDSVYKPPMPLARNPLE